MTSNPPPDRYKAVWLIFFTLGLGTLLPWNFFMTATMYFTERLADPTNGTTLDRSAVNITTSEPISNISIPKQNYLQAKFNNVMTLCAMLPLLIFTCLNSFLHQRISQKVRILGSLVAILVVFMLTALFVKISFEPLTFFILTMIKIVCINCFGAILQGSLFGMAGLLPASYTTPIMSGQGLAGTFAAFAMICAITSGSELEESAFGYFITACVVILLAIVAYIALPKLEFFRHHVVKDTTSQSNEANAEHETKINLMNKGEENPYGKDGVLSRNDSGDKKNLSVIVIFTKLWLMALSVCLVFTVTIGVFPAVTADAKSTVAGSSAWNGYFIPVSCFLLFNLCDWAGRSLTAICMWPGKDSYLLHILVIARLIFIPLFMLCNVHPRQYLPVFLEHDAYYILIMIVFAFSNGYLASLCMCFGPKKVLPHEAETAGAIMAFFLSLGLALGAAFSFLFRELV
uniref:Equilibrative nucleoside transporter 1 n=1 Tax=Geotrypetes seraphini TaxID=260995 RepID=A0A6P8Q890_GEOSA|nr:equilibrative nucleoside transporter 1 [Geotrypetes seraphini]XP_033792486.1 equilibrative nucleoside transporter 1 [Geotrypetes seraphini]XP_033792488.1 equilibrative nucleoside transporter 1 [Geotrypetes seraphini]XP_033792489.1 equilibrative nucleoside transporter 1 [Geotrypetes seraphini]XP_033792490.1 equilibrative nucleoside transporter 1 [Geotrypetes seraphini]XP_033792491.1 equilibrative nucleoside transporter 1 [Geotrypetes seraphini]XP_033792492.1 equilibrative nucleoside transpo